MSLYCGDCKEEVTTCDECGEEFKEGEEILCHSFDHIHKDCVSSWETEVVSEEDRYDD